VGEDLHWVCFRVRTSVGRRPAGDTGVGAGLDFLHLRFRMSHPARTMGPSRKSATNRTRPYNALFRAGRLSPGEMTTTTCTQKWASGMKISLLPAAAQAFWKVLETLRPTATAGAHTSATRHRDYFMHTLLHRGKTASASRGYLRVTMWQAKSARATCSLIISRRTFSTWLTPKSRFGIRSDRPPPKTSGRA
jgi:hypothetical protein